jgi:ABC-2 type transport system permease protein
VLLSGIVLFTFFADATSGAVTAVLDRENLVRKIEFPRLVVPFAVVTTAFFNLAANLLAVLVFILATGVDPRPSWLLALPLIAVLVVLALGVAMLLSALYPRYRDVRPIWEVVLQIIFYASPILYAIEVIPKESYRHLIMLSPVAAVIESWRHWIIDPSAPTAAQAIGGAELLLIPAAIVVGVFALGLWVFARQAPRLAEEL